MAKVECPACSKRMPEDDRFCFRCGAERGRTVTKSAPAYAPVTDMAEVRRRQSWDEIRASPNPSTREYLIETYFGGDVA